MLTCPPSLTSGSSASNASAIIVGHDTVNLADLGDRILAPGRFNYHGPIAAQCMLMG
jgi:hypothetical protein